MMYVKVNGCFYLMVIRWMENVLIIRDEGVVILGGKEKRKCFFFVLSGYEVIIKRM